MAALWTSAISSAWGVVSDLVSDFLPVLGVAMGLVLVAWVIRILLGMFKGA